MVLKKYYFLIVFGLFLLFASCNRKIEKTCHLVGEVIGRNSKTLCIKKETDDYNPCQTAIPIDSSGHFSYDLKYDFVEAYELVFTDELDNGLWKPVLFFPDADTIKFTLYSMQDFDSDRITGSSLSSQESLLMKKLMDTYYDSYMMWGYKNDSLNKLKEQDSEYAELVKHKLDSINRSAYLFKLHYAKKKADIYGFYKLIDILKEEKERRLISMDTLKDYCDFFQKKYPSHPYSEISKYRLNGLENIKVGGHFVDFGTTDSIGNTLYVSEVIFNNKITLVDLWSPWCAPCIRKSKNMIPVYQKYNDLGFEIYSVCGGINNKEQFINAVKKYNFPWKVTSEINNSNKVWEKYCIPNSGGKQFLINKKGVIVSINPSPVEIIEIMESKEKD